MQKKLLIITACMIIAVVIAGIAVTNRASKESRQVEQILQDDSEEETAFVSLAEVRKEADAVIEAGRNGEYRNLQFNEISPLIPEEDRIYSIKVTAPDVPVTEENLDKALDMIRTLLEDPVDEELIKALMPADKYGNTLGNLSVEELREGIRRQDEDYTWGEYTLFYLNDELDQCAQIGSTMSILWIDRGLENVTPLDENELEQVYYPGAEDGSLQDVYETASGEMSVGEAIKQVENFFNNEFPVTIPKELGHQVARVYILKMPDGTYGFECAMTESYGGVRFESANSGVVLQEEDDTYTLSLAVLDREKHVLFFNGLIVDRKIEETNEITEVIPLKRATEYISQKIGDNTIYTVKGIELSYMGKEKIAEDGSYYEIWTPKWIFFTNNETSGEDVRFYVDVLTGEVETRKISD